MVALKVTTHGPVFNGIGAKILHQAERDAVQDLVELGERRVQSQLYPGHGLVTGNYRRGIVGQVGGHVGGAGGVSQTSGALLQAATRDIARGGLQGVVHDSGIIYGPWLEGVSSRNDATRFKGYRMFRNAVQDLNRIAPTILRRHLTKAARKI